MNIIDIGIILFILSGAIIGLKRGFTKQLVSSIGFILIVILSFILKNPVSIFFYEHLPFFKFSGIIKGVTVLNIALYEIFAFFIVFSILTIVYKILSLATSIFEKVLKATIILGIPSKILGAILGFIQYFILAFIILYVLNFPTFNILDDSKLKDPILKHTPILSSFAHDTVSVIDEFKGIKEKYKNESNAKEFNRETLDLFLKYDIVKCDSIDLLIDKNKLDIKKDDPILVKYRNEE